MATVFEGFDAMRRQFPKVAHVFIIMLTAHEQGLATPEDRKAFFAETAKRRLEIEVKLNGVELDFVRFCERLEAAWDGSVTEAAMRLLTERAGEFAQRLVAMTYELERQVHQKVVELFPGARLDDQ